MQPNQIKNLTEIDVKNTTKIGYVAERARGAYIAYIYMPPDATYAFSITYHVTDHQEKDFKNTN